ncbi:MAG: hypothetical protein RJB38_556 [Pseudomonadota bacterium]
MASYVVLARKWRPAQFADIVGQGPVVRTLMNAIQSNRLHQAYLFTGSRGIGKTSIARIISKAIRCPNHQWDGTWLRCCDQCSSCLEIARGSSVDVIEIDGASNNGVEHVREIRENARFLPSSGTRKVYIIDEVHMLSTAAFNALLKTLEEPPAHVLFILATTEPHKIPATILSRCQRFDLKRVSAAQIEERLSEVLKAEGIEAETGALALIARAAEGGLRDALSLLDQVIAFSGPRISVQTVRESTGIIESQLILEVLKSVLAREPLPALAGVQSAYQQGHDLKLLARHLIEFLHGVILAKVGATAPSLTLFSASEWQEIESLAPLRDLEELELIFQALHHGVEWIARSPTPKLVLDVLLIKCSSSEALLASDGAPAERSPNPASVQRPTPSALGKSSATTSRSPGIPAQPISQPVPTPSPSRSYEGFVEHVRQQRPLLASVLEHFHAEQLPSLHQHRLALVCLPHEGFYREQLINKSNAEPLFTFARDYFGAATQVAVEIAASDQTLGASETIAARKARETREQEERSKQVAANHPVIREAKNLFGGELSPIEIRNPEDPSEGSGDAG